MRRTTKRIGDAFGRSRRKRRHKLRDLTSAASGRKLRFEAFEQRLVLATFMVTSDMDNGSGGLTLREAIELANDSDDPQDTITFDPSVFDGGDPIELSQGELFIEEVTSLLIDGTTGGGTLGVTIEAAPFSRIFKIESFAADPTIELKGLTLTGGQTGSAGGAIDTREHLIVRDSIITGSSSEQRIGPRAITSSGCLGSAQPPSRCG